MRLFGGTNVVKGFSGRCRSRLPRPPDVLRRWCVRNSEWSPNQAGKTPLTDFNFVIGHCKNDAPRAQHVTALKEASNYRQPNTLLMRVHTKQVNKQSHELLICLLLSSQSFSTSLGILPREQNELGT